MKNQIEKKAISVFAFLMLAFYSIAEDDSLLDIDIDINKDEWYENPYLWVGVAAFLILLAFISRKSRK